MILTILHLRNPKTGGQYRKTLQYGFDIQQALDARLARPKKGKYERVIPDWKRKQEQEETEADMYACGFLPPNHAMPAIQYRAHYSRSPKGFMWLLIRECMSSGLWFAVKSWRAE